MLQMPSTRSRFVRKLSLALTQRCGVRPESGIVVSVSGGADSMALLAGLVALARRPHMAYRLRVAHVNHGLRPEAADEARHVQQVAEQLHLSCDVIDLDPSTMTTKSVSSWARRERYRALARVVEQYDDAAVLATAHHGTDQLETLLMNLIRGAGPAGLGAMRWRRRVFECPVVRPLLDQTHDDCVALCRSLGWEWVEDPSNRKTDQRRNRIRAQLLPLLHEIAPDLEARIHRTTDLLTDMSALLSFSADALIDIARTRSGDDDDATDADPSSTSTVQFDRARLSQAHRIVVAEAMRKTAVSLGAPARKLSTEVINAAARAVMDARRHPRMLELPGGVIMRVTSRRVRMERGISDEPHA